MISAPVYVSFTCRLRVVYVFGCILGGGMIRQFMADALLLVGYFLIRQDWRMLFLHNWAARVFILWN